MIHGVGSDLVELERIGEIVGKDKAGEAFIKRVLTPEEQELAAVRSGRLVEFVGGRFAVKEAVVKALGCGIGYACGFQDITVLPDPMGKPVCLLSEQARTRLQLPESARIHVSISHSRTTACAFAVVELP